jgi:hypothetical protein
MDSIVPCWFMFHLECDKGRESSSYQIYIELCYSYVLVLLLFYKVKILSILYFSFGIKSAFCHKTVVTIRRQKKKGRHEI